MRSHLKQINIHLKRSIAEQSHKLTFSLYLFRHDVEYDNFKGADILMLRPFLRHYEYIFIAKRFECWKLG